MIPLRTQNDYRLILLFLRLEKSFIHNHFDNCQHHERSVSRPQVVTEIVNTLTDSPECPNGRHTVSGGQAMQTYSGFDPDSATELLG